MTVIDITKNTFNVNSILIQWGSTA